MNLIVDIETDGFYQQCTRIHCVVVQDVETNEVLVFNDQGSKPPISQAITLLEDADHLIGHNIINFDIPVIQKFYPWFDPNKCLDTLVMGRVIHSDIDKVDLKKKWEFMPVQLYGRHSLEAYGYRLGIYKGGFAKQTDWKEWSQDMEDYCVQDIAVTSALWNHFQKYLTGSP